MRGQGSENHDIQSTEDSSLTTTRTENKTIVEYRREQAEWKLAGGREVDLSARLSALIGAFNLAWRGAALTRRLGQVRLTIPHFAGLRRLPAFHNLAVLLQINFLFLW